MFVSSYCEILVIPLHSTPLLTLVPWSVGLGWWKKIPAMEKNPLRQQRLLLLSPVSTPVAESLKGWEMSNRTDLKNKGLISADRKTSLLSCLQYHVPYLSRLQRIYLSQYLKLWFRVSLNLMVLGRTNVLPIVTHVTLGKVNIVAFQHGFWLRGVQS